MSNIAFYLKYRPQALSDLVGQEAVKNTLETSFKNNKLSHAYLFVGPRGTGKTSTARILAKMVNCPAERNIPCNGCDSCLSITDGSNLDLIEIDAASHRGIEDIRSLRDKIKLAPTGAKKKVYIIDEVHMLTTEAFNALLKTLEEPPAHALFILATTEVSKIPQTILSRVQRLDFKLASNGQLQETLRKIIKEEKIDIDEEALSLLIKASDGSFRDAVKLLDQVSSLDEKITAQVLEKSLKSSNFDDVLEIISAFSKKDARRGLLTVLKQVEYGVDIKDFIISLMDSLRNLVFIKNGLGEELVKPHLIEEKYQNLNTLAGDFSDKQLIDILEILQNNLEKLKITSIPSLPLELAMVEICGSEGDPPEKIVAPPAAPDEPVTSSPDSPDILKIKEKWTFVLETIRPYNFSLEALLRSINVKDCNETQVFMEVPYSFHQRILEAPKNRDLLEGVLSDILGRSIKVLVVLGNRPARREDIANVEVAADDEIIRAAAEIFNSDTVN